MEWHVFVIAQKGRDGKPQGAHKVSDGRFHMVVEDAQEALDELPPDVRGSFGVFPAIIEIHPTIAE